MTPKKTLKKWFSNFMKPLQEHFWALIDSFWHKSDKIPMSSIDGLDRIVEGTASAGQLLNHINDTNAHRTLFDQKVDKEEGKGLSTEDFTTEYKQKLQNLQPTDLQPLQEKITAIENTLAVDDTNLDTLQEIITQVKANKNLERLLTDKVDKEEGKGLSANNFTNEHKQKLETVGLFEGKIGTPNFGQGEEIKKYYITDGNSGDIDISTLPKGSAIELYNFGMRCKKIKVDNYFGDTPFIGAKGSKVLLKKLQDGRVFIEHFNKNIVAEPFPKKYFENSYKAEFNKEIVVHFYSNVQTCSLYVSIPLTDEQKYRNMLCFSVPQNSATEISSDNISLGETRLSNIVLSPTNDGINGIKYSINPPIYNGGSIEISNLEIYRANYILFVYEIDGLLTEIEGGSGSVNLVLNSPTITGKNFFKN